MERLLTLNKNFCVLLLALSMTTLTGCKQASKAFDELVSGNFEDVDELTLVDVIPDVTSVVIEQSQSQLFVANAKAPTGRIVTYTWKLDGATVLTGSTKNYSITASLANVGAHTLEIVVNDGVLSKSKSWSIKVNGPPTVTKVTTGTPKVSVGSTVNISATATDPNNDTLTYTWLLNGVANANLVGTTGTAVLTGALAEVGSVNITLTVSDGTATDSTTWTAEINHFPNACNTLVTGQICTYAGNPSVGDDIDPLTSSIDERVSVIDTAQDSLGNIFMADWENNVIWYWNKTTNPVTRLGITIPGNRLKRVAGTGEQASGGDGIALESAVNRPRGLWYNDASNVLYVAEYSANRIRYIDSNGFIFTGMGAGASHVDGATAYSHDCDIPTDLHFYSNNLYVACRNEHRVKRWDLNTDLAYTVYGTGGSGFNGEGGAATSAQSRYPTRLFVDADGIYVTHDDRHRVRFINHSGGVKTFWGGATSVNNGAVRTIIGTGSANAEDNKLPTTNRIGNPSGIAVRNNVIYLNVRWSNRDRIYAANNSGGPITIGGVTISDARIRYITHQYAGYNGTGSINGIRVNDAYGLDIDVLNNNQLIISDYGNRRVRYADISAGTLNDYVGSGKARWGFFGDVPLPTQEHLFNQPTGLAWDTTNRKLLFSDMNNYRVREVDAYGRIQTALGRGNGDPSVENDIPSNALTRMNYSGNNYMNGLSLLPDNSMFQLNIERHSFRVWNRSGTSKSYFNTYIQDNRVSNVAGDYLVAAGGNGPDGAALSSLMRRPADVKTRDNAGTWQTYVVDQFNHCIKELTPSGNLNSVLGTCGATGNSGVSVAAGSAAFNRPHGLTFDPNNGNVIFTDTWNSKVRYWNRTGASVTFAGQTINANTVQTIVCANGTTGSASENIFATSARCYRPLGIAMSPDGTKLCFANTWRHNVRCVNVSDGRINTVAGQPEAAPRAGSPIGFEQEGVTATSATLYYPTDVTFDNSGDLLISDRANHIIRKVKLSP